MELTIIEEAASTNSLAANMAAERDGAFALMARRQTAGRGQRGNTWEAAPGQNVTMSVCCRFDNVAAAEQFVILQSVAVALVETLRRNMPEVASGRIAVKWPNDIYVDDRKLCGVLIENSLSGTAITRSVIGIGLNVNQTEFVSDAPNPVSMRGVTAGRSYEVDDIARQLCDAIERASAEFLADRRYDELRRRYTSMLWRGEGFHPYVDVATGRRFEARITNIAPSGHITLTERDGRHHVYAFKEVQSVLTPAEIRI